jgi:redox-regulated HSP33 family molecular chaperone
VNPSNNLTGVLKEQDTIEFRCEFCGQRYPFSQEVLTGLIKERG